MKKVDAIIVGQGLAGTCMAMTLLEMGVSVHVFDPCMHRHNGSKNASRSAAGLFNSITGRKMVKTWKADALFQGLEDFYMHLEEKLSVQCFNKIPMYRPFSSIEDQNDWVGAELEEDYGDYIDEVLTGSIGLEGVCDPYGGLVLKRTGYVAISRLLDAARDYLEKRALFSETVFDLENLKLESDRVTYLGESHQLEAKWVIYCNGVGAIDDRSWSFLRFKPVKGEWLEMDLEIPSNLIINRGVFMIPGDGKVKVGATYDHSDFSGTVSEKGRTELIRRLAKIFTGEYRILDQHAGVRPATFDRRPFVGVHPTISQFAILNGLGAKGVTLAPYFAGLLANFLLEKQPLPKEVDCNR